MNTETAPKEPGHGVVQSEQDQRWMEKNWEAITSYNRRVADVGLLSDDSNLLCSDRDGTGKGPTQ